MCQSLQSGVVAGVLLRAKVSDPFLNADDFRPTELSFRGHMRISPGMELRDQPALFRLAGHEDRAAFSSFEKALERTKVEATLFLSPSVALDAMLFQKRGKFIELSGLANQRQECEDQVVDGVEFQSLETIADQTDGAIASLCGQWAPLREPPTHAKMGLTG